MSRLTLVLRLAAIAAHAAVALMLTMGTSADATIVINNGLAPPNPANVINSDYGDAVYVRNVGCPPGWPDANPDDPCPSPGAPTEVEIVDGTIWYPQAHESSSITMSGGEVGYDLAAFDSSTVTLSGGTVNRNLTAHSSSSATMRGGYVVEALEAFGASSVTMSGGEVGSDLAARFSSSITMSGGLVWGELLAYHSSIIEIIGSDFKVGHSPQPYGDLSATTGVLTGTLASGESLINVFYQGGYDGSLTGTIRLTLVPEPSTALLLAFGLAGLAVGRRSVA
jgi:hypothetical protein